MHSINQLGIKIVSLLRSQVDGIRLIYLFGSQVSEQATKSSDIDIAILTEQKLNPLKRWDLQNYLAEELQTDVDLVDLLTASTVIKNQIINKGVCLFDPDNKAAEFEMQVTSMYQRLNEERAEILEQQMSD